MTEVSMPEDKRIAWLSENVPHFKSAFYQAQAVKTEEAANRAQHETKDNAHD